MDISIRELNLDQLRDALPLVWRVFSFFEWVNYTEEGKKAFFNAIHDERYLKKLYSYGAFLKDNLVGFIATRNNMSHIALFFVDGKYQNMGVGSMLWNKVKEESKAPIITVHSSIYAKEIYKKLEFLEEGSMIDDGGILYIPMKYNNLVEKLKDKDENKAYALTKDICAESTSSDKYYQYFDDFLSLLKEENSYYKIRGLLIIASLSKWDREGKVKKAIHEILSLLDDEKPIVVRKCLKALTEIVQNSPEVIEETKESVQKINISRYKDTMAPLIKKDIERLLENIRPVRLNHATFLSTSEK